MQRRGFLTLAAGAAAAPAMQRPPLGIGFLGAVHPHFDGKLQAARSISGLRIIAVCEREPNVREALRKQSVPLLSREELLSHPDIQVIAVESSVRDHAADGLAALHAGKHLHLEKSPADNMTAFRRIVEAARQRNLRLQVGYIFRRHPGINMAVEAARKGWLGDVYMVRANIGTRLEKLDRALSAEFPGGVMFELGGHVIDPIVRLMGRPLKVTAALHKDGAFNDNLKDNTVALLEWQKATGIVQAAAFQPGASRYRAFELYGANGSFVVNPLEPGGAVVDLERAAGPYASGTQRLSLPGYKRYEDDLRDMVAAIRGETDLPVSYDEDLAVHEILLRCSGMHEVSE